MITLEIEIDKGVFPMAPSKTGFKLTTLDLVYISLFSVLIAICAWIAIPSMVPFTLQTFGVMCTLGLLGGKRGTLAVLVYLLLGAVGIPVFSNFRGGIGMLVGSTGGYLLGFLFSALLYWLLTSLFGNRFFIRVVSMLEELCDIENRLSVLRAQKYAKVPGNDAASETSAVSAEESDGTENAPASVTMETPAASDPTPEPSDETPVNEEPEYIPQTIADDTLANPESAPSEESRA